MAHQPHFLAATAARQQQVANRPDYAQTIAPTSSTTSQPRPFYLSAAGSRNKNHKGTFEAFTYESASPLYSPDRAGSAKRFREVDHKGAPLNIHRGVTSLRRKNTEGGIPNQYIPDANISLMGTKEFEWHPSAYSNGGMMVQDNFRSRGEGLDGVKRKQASIQKLHGSRGDWSFGPNNYHGLFDKAVRPLTRNHEVEAKTDPASLAARTHSRVPHRVPFRGGAAPKGVDADRSFISGHEHFPYHYSDYSFSEKSLVETKISNNSSCGFRQQCAHAIHYPFKSATSRTSRPTETDRNSNFHAIQARDETCYHRCNHVLAEAYAQNAAQQNDFRAQTAPQQPAFTNRF